MDFVIIMILFDVTDYRLLYGSCSISLSPYSEKNIHMTVKIFANVHQVMFSGGTKARMDTYKI